MNLDRARNPHALVSTLKELVEGYSGGDRDLGEALLLNPSLQAEEINILLEKCSLDLRILALTHPNLSADKQIDIIMSVLDSKFRTKAKLALLHRSELNKDILAILCLDPDESVRNVALKRLKGFIQ